jgi:DNA repair protein RadA/Sms
VHRKWAGQCSDCGEWNTLVEERSEQAPKAMSRSKKGAALEFASGAGEAEPVKRLETGLSELDRVLGGGLVPGSVTLIGGDPGIGKSTLLLQLVAALGATGTKTAYISGEESVAQIQMRAQRLAVPADGLAIAAANSVRDIVLSLEKPGAAEVAVIDSIQTMFVDSVESAPGTVTQVRACSNELVKLAKKRNIAVFLVGHVTKDGQLAGPRVMEHMVDTVLYFEGDRGHPYRILRTVKNRFGATDEIGVFEMQEKGLLPVANPSSLFISDSDEAVSGSAVFAGVEGSRPLLCEIQALVASSSLATPRRAVVGWDSARLAMMLAVLEARAGLRFSDKEVYLNVAGGLRINEPAADLAVAAALISALSDVPLPPRTVWFGEIGLSGAIRPAGRVALRLKEAEKLGFTAAVLPAGSAGTSNNLRLNQPSAIQELVAFLQQERY